MDLASTIELMLSDDYKSRFKAEYYQLKTRYEKLHTMVTKLAAGTLDFTPKCSYELLKEQEDIMAKYLYTLEVRAQVEEIEL